jgi:hypothetical protein
MDQLLKFISWVSLALIAFVLFSVRRLRIRVEYSVSWLAASVLMLAVSSSPELVRWLAARIGLPDGPLALVIIVFSLFLVVFYRFTIIISGLKDSNIALAQRVAILEHHVTALHEKQEENDSPTV